MGGLFKWSKSLKQRLSLLTLCWGSKYKTIFSICYLRGFIAHLLLHFGDKCLTAFTDILQTSILQYLIQNKFGEKVSLINLSIRLFVWLLPPLYYGQLSPGSRGMENPPPLQLHPSETSPQLKIKWKVSLPLLPDTWG